MYDNLITSDHLEQVVQKIQNTKASKSTTLSGYGITDSYTKTETDNRIQDIVGAAPEALDTLEEIAEALQDGESTTAGLVQTLSQKADKSTTVTNIAYGSKKLTKTINGSTTDVVTINAIKSDLALTKSDVGLSNVDNTSDANKPVSNATQTALDTKVDKVSGKGLSTNDYTTTEKNKLSGIASNAQVNIIESIKVNNTVLPISSKAVNITVPTKTSELTNNSNFAVDSNYVHTDNNYTTAEKQKLASKVAELDDNGKVLSSQLPSYVDNVVEYASSANFPTTGESGKIYVDTGANLTYRWTGSTYTEISPSLALGETGSTAYRGDRGKVAYTHATDSNRLTTAKTSGLYKISTTAEGHVASAEIATKSDIGLGNVDNTSDLDKPISTVTQEALNTKVNVTTSVLKSDEEFTYRQTGGSLDIDAKYGKLKSIKGQTLVWNQLENGTWQSSYNLVKSGNTYTLSAAVARDTITMYYSKPFISGHKYFVKAHFKLNRETSMSGSFYLGYFATPTQWIGYAVAVAGEDLRAGFDFKNIITLATDKTTLYLGPYHTGTTDQFATTDTIVISNPQVYDLTLMFGAGNEPSTPEEFEALYPGPFYDYNPGTLISNASTAIETVGWNLVDIDSIFSGISGWQNLGGGEWYVPAGKANTGTKVWENNFGYTGQVHIHYERKAITGLNGERLQFYYADGSYELCNPSTVLNTYQTGNFLSNSSKIVDHIELMYGSGAHDCYLKDICINLSDPSRNGTYEPYWRSELELGLGDIKVKSHNIWDEELEQYSYNQTTGEKQQSGSSVRSVNKITVIPSASYYFRTGISITFRLFLYYSNEEYKESVLHSSNSVYQVPSDVYYIAFQIATLTYGEVYNHDICINLSDPAFNGRYERYGDGGVISITGGLKSSGVVYDEISGGKLIKRIEKVTLDGTTKAVAGAYTPDGASITRFGYAGAQDTAEFSANTIYVSDKFIYAIGTATAEAYQVTNTNTTGANRLFIWLPSSVANTDSAANTWLSNNPSTFYYQLAQPIEYELYNPIDLSYKVYKFGTEKLLPESTSGIISSTFRADIEYRTTNVTIDDVYGGSDIIKSVEDVDSRLTTVEKSINGLVTIGSGSPTTIPKNIGDFYIDVTNKVLYFATGNQLISDWNS